MRWPVWAAAALLAGSLVAAVLVLRSRGAPTATPAATGSETKPGVSAPYGRASGAPPRSTRQRLARVPIPRLQTAPEIAAEAPPVRRPSHATLEGGRAQIFDRRLDQGSSGEALRLRLRDHLRAVDDGVEDCLALHAAEDPSLAAGVVLAFSLDASGLQEVWLEDHAPVSAGPLACLSRAVYGVDWRGLTSEPIQLSRRMRTRQARSPAPPRRAPAGRRARSFEELENLRSRP
jgi:hypothetical protein